MALLLKTKSRFGVEGDYWNLCDYKIYKPHKMIEFRMTLYVDEESHAQGMESLEFKRFRVIGPKFEQYFTPQKVDEYGNLEKSIYDYLKNEEPFYSEALDLI